MNLRFSKGKKNSQFQKKVIQYTLDNSCKGFGYLVIPKGFSFYYAFIIELTFIRCFLLSAVILKEGYGYIL